MNSTRIGFIGLGNVGGSLASNLLRHGVDLTVRDLNEELVGKFVALGAKRGNSPKEMAEQVDIIITCLPSPAATAAVMERPDGILAGLGSGKTWLEMSTTAAAEIMRLAPLIEARGATAMDCPVVVPVTVAVKAAVPPTRIVAAPGEIETATTGVAVTETLAVAVFEGSATVVATTWNVPVVAGAR